MYQIKIGTDQYNPEINVISSDIKSIFNIYWNYHNSVQSINSEFYVQCIDLNTYSYIDITKGSAHIKYTHDKPIKCVKNHSYMIDRVTSLIKLKM